MVETALSYTAYACNAVFHTRIPIYLTIVTLRRLLNLGFSSHLANHAGIRKLDARKARLFESMVFDSVDFVPRSRGMFEMGM